MNVSSPQELLQRSLAQVSRAVATKTTFPILSNVLIDADGESLRLAATNQEIGISSSIPAQVDEPGRVTVDARLLSEFVNTLPHETVRLSTDLGRLMLKVNGLGADAEINGIDAEEFPLFPRQEDGAFTASVDPQMLREMIGLVEFAAASDDSRPVLAGVLIRFEDNRIIMAAADGFRLAVREGELVSSVLERLDIIVPARALRELARIIGDRTEPIALRVTPNRGQLLVETEDTEFYSRLIDGTFPDFRQIVPPEFATRIELGRDDFLAAVRRAGFFARDNNDVVRLSAKMSDDELAAGNVQVSANAAERGSSQSDVAAAIQGPEGQIAFNSRYLVDVLSVLRSARVMLGMNGANQAGVVRSLDSDSYTYVIMPMVIGAN
ncbi:MAG: DNA polymerase III subunit beta [Chloroflexota bacterium]|nr:DNA polymerase III subunit beta [Chloroflexia bacterium]MDQ3225717.1 DNA polymerase III subunit beta [Chloroflexota bacterium]